MSSALVEVGMDTEVCAEAFNHLQVKEAQSDKMCIRAEQYEPVDNVAGDDDEVQPVSVEAVDVQAFVRTHTGSRRGNPKGEVPGTPCHIRRRHCSHFFLQRVVCVAGMACQRRNGQHRSRAAHCDGNLLHGGFPRRRRLGAARKLHFSGSTFSSDGTIISIGEDGSACFASAAPEIKLDKEFKYE